MIIRIFLLSVICFTNISCRERSANGAPAGRIVRDTTITPEISFSLLTIDSLYLISYFNEHSVEENTRGKMIDFYNSRNFQYAWFTEEGPAEHTGRFWNLHEQFIDINRDSSFFNKQLHDRMKRILEDDEQLSAARLAETELQLTEHFFDFARYAYDSRLDPSSLQWHIPKAKVDAVQLLDSLIVTNGSNLDQWQPVNKNFQLISSKLATYHAIEKSGAWRALDLQGEKTLREGDSSAAVVQLKKNLSLLGDYEGNVQAPVFTSDLTEAVIRFQRRHGLTDDGVVGPNFLKAINVPVEDRIEQMLINMERMRWLPAEENGHRVVVNIPEFKLHVYNGNKEEMQMTIVVGKPATKTVIFSDEIKYVVFAPYWNIPKSIVRNEIVPAMNRNSNYLSSNNMEITGRSGGLPVIRQKPGPGNALGRVKFLFPNRYNIYLHDTPAKSLFDRTTRAFSHGCIRIERPDDFVHYLLNLQGTWSMSDVKDHMNRSTEKWVTLPATVPVYIVYFTSWVDGNGTLHFRDDIYGHDARMAKLMFRHEAH